MLLASLYKSCCFLGARRKAVSRLAPFRSPFGCLENLDLLDLLSTSCQLPAAALPERPRERALAGGAGAGTRGAGGWSPGLERPLRAHRRRGDAQERAGRGGRGEQG